MKHPRVLISFIISSLLFLPSCRYIRWASQQLPQGASVSYQENVVRRSLRSLHLYDQFDTLAHFDVLWLSDEVRCMYANVYGVKHGLCDERFEEFEHRQLEENAHFISFYVLAAMPDTDDTLLSDKNATWSIYLKIDGEIYQPIEIKPVELVPEYKLFFGVRFTKFKKSFLVKFDARAVDGSELIDEDTQCLELWFRRTDRYAHVYWQIVPENRPVHNLEQECNTLAYDLKT